MCLLDRAAKKSRELRLWRQVIVLSLNDMAEKKKPVKKDGRYCVAGAPNNQSCTNTSYTLGISMDQFPVDRAVREKWVKFVQRHRVDFKEPISKHASLCSVHFERSCYENSLAFTLEDMADTKRNSPHQGLYSHNTCSCVSSFGRINGSQEASVKPWFPVIFR